MQSARGDNVSSQPQVARAMPRDPDTHHLERCTHPPKTAMEWLSCTHEFLQSNVEKRHGSCATAPEGLAEASKIQNTKDIAYII